MTFLTVRPRTPGGTSPSNLSGYDLAVGYITKPPVTIPLGAAYSIIWRIAAGSGLTMPFGFIALLPSMRSKAALSKTSVKYVSELIGIAGIVIPIGAIVTAIEFSSATDIGIFLGSDYPFSHG